MHAPKSNDGQRGRSLSFAHIQRWARYRFRRRPGLHPRLESLEGRQLLSDLPAISPIVAAQTAAASTSPATFPVTVSFTKSDDWQTGFTASIAIHNTGSTTIKGWTLAFDLPATIDPIWNARIISRQGSRYVLGDMGYNAVIAPGATISLGFNGSPGNLTAQPANVVFNGAPVGSPVTPPPPSPLPLPTLSIADTAVLEGNPQQGSSGFLRTAGNQIVDEANQPVRIAGVNWFGLETPNFAPHGLWTRNYKDMMDQMKQLGFNTIRLPFSNQLFDAGSVPNSIDYAKNPDLQGLNGLQIIDRIVEYAGTIGLRIILDHHRSTAGNSAQESGLWYTPEYPESRWIGDWTMLAVRYKGNPTVIGADLHNEPHGPATWGSGDARYDWRLAAERGGNAILAANSDWLIIVEGVEATASGSTWWGGNLSNAGAFPVRLNTPGRLVYSPHEYPASVYNQSWFSDPSYPSNLPAIWDRNWGYLFRQGTAPLLIGEFGSKFATTSDSLWAAKLVEYLKGDLDGNGSNDLPAGQLGVSWTWWSWNPNSGDTGGILKDDWSSVHQNKVDLLAPVQFPLAASSQGSARALFTVTLSQAASTPVTVRFATVSGTATAGSDYTSSSGTLTFAPGETTKTIAVAISGDLASEPDETFRITLSDPAGATVSDGDATATIRNDDSPPPPALPSLSITSASVAEGNTGSRPLTFTVTLSEPSTRTVTVAYSTANGTATASSDYSAVSGTLTFSPGTTSKTIAVPVQGDTSVEGNETFQLGLSSPTNATLATAQATGTILNDDAPQTVVSVSYVVRDDWGAGFLADITIRNNSTTAINGWTLAFDLPVTITGIWNAQIVSRVGNRYTIRNASWNRLIAPGQSITFGFQATPGRPPRTLGNRVFNGQPIPV